MRIRKNGDLLKRARNRMEESAGQAESYARNPSRLRRLIFDAKDRLMQLDGRKHNLRNFILQVTVFGRMLKDYSMGLYPALPWKTLISMVASLLYFLNPLDLIPDFIPALGLVDDITLLAWVYKSLENDVENYLSWAEANDD